MNHEARATKLHLTVVHLTLVVIHLVMIHLTVVHGHIAIHLHVLFRRDIACELRVSHAEDHG